MSDGGEGCRKMCELSGEPLIKGMIVGTEKNILTTSQLHEVSLASNHQTIQRQKAEPVKLLFEKRNAEIKYLKQWVDAQVDAIVTPVKPFLGYTPKTYVSGPQYAGYTALWNFLNYACLVMPISTVSVDKDRPDEDWLRHMPRNPADEFNYKQCKFVDGCSHFYT